MITLTGNPLSTQHIYLMKGRMRFMKAEAKTRKLQYQWEAKSQWKGKPLEGNLFAEITLYFGDKRRRDWDNFHKLSMDAISDIVYVDDSQVKEARIKIAYDKENPRITIDVSELK